MEDVAKQGQRLWLPQARVTPIGDLQFPHRGTPPKAICGYVVSTTDPFTHKFILKQCQFRKIEYEKACGGLRIKFHCAHFKMQVSGSDCLACTERKE